MDTASRFDHRAFLQSVTSQPGVYQMVAADGSVLYIGKAKNLKNRLASYFQQHGLAAKTRALVAKIASIEVTVTHTEVEALLLEQNLIKQQRPPYNILLRDDKSYPTLYLSAHHYPRLSLHRGAKKRQGRYFGPYPSVVAAKESLNFLQKTFKLRQCDDIFFKNRSRPCLQYQIKRCSAPCVQYIDVDQYAESVRHATMLLDGKNKDLMTELADKMEACAQRLQFEQAAHYRDTLRALQQLQTKQYIEGAVGDSDVVACAGHGAVVCIHMLLVRDGRVLGSKSYFPKVCLGETPAQILTAFVASHYLEADGLAVNDGDLPREIIVSEPLLEPQLLQQALMERAGRQVAINARVRSHRAKWLALAKQAAQHNLHSYLATKQSVRQRFEALQDALSLAELPQRLECFDVSHSSGEATVASCVVFDRNGPLTADYRRFNIDNITAADDYAAMHQALLRHYTRVKLGEKPSPDILVIDGGKGQVKQAVEALEALQIINVLVIGVTKGEGRKAGLETFYRADTRRVVMLPADSPAHHLLQHIRDEAHRFAVTGHRQRRDKKRAESPLQSVAGIGPKRRRELLRHFGGWREVNRASVDDLAAVSGISKKLAQSIYDALHGG